MLGVAYLKTNSYDDFFRKSASPDLLSLKMFAQTKLCIKFAPLLPDWFW
ncbi:hypothetical protein MNBD_BACTEROID03-1107 [hydrothermal vent metagenome]|uniref:Uncharacterized protein n=1 Tax=hydrothermal vent metagenome TaxID=652676 RepID=A0A3B0TVU1_9ZZZZ